MADLEKILKKCQRARTVDRLHEKIIGGIIIALLASVFFYGAYRLVRPKKYGISRNKAETLMADLSRPARFAP